MTAAGLWIGLALLQGPAAPPVSSPRTITQWAVAAVEGDSVRRVHQRWTAELARDPKTRAAALGLGTLARLTYRFPESERLLRTLVTGPTPDRFTVAGWLGLAYAAYPHGSLDTARVRLDRAADAARTLGDSVQYAEAVIGQASMIGRAIGADSGLRLLDHAEKFLTGTDRLGRAMLLCRRGQLAGNLGNPGARAMTEAGRSLADQEGDRRLVAACDHTVAAQISQRGFVDSALQRLIDVAERQIQLRDRQGLAQTLQWNAFLRSSAGSLGRASRIAGFALAQADTSGNRSVRAWTLLTVSHVAAIHRDLPKATEALVEAESIFRTTGDWSGVLAALSRRATIASGEGRRDQAYGVLQTALQLSGRFFEHWRPSLLRGMAAIRMEQDRPAEADSLLLEALALAQRNRMLGLALGIQFDQATVALRLGHQARAETILQAQLKQPENASPALRNIQAMAMASIAVQDGRIALAESLMVAAGAATEIFRSRLSDEALRVQAFEVIDRYQEREFEFARVTAGLVRHDRLRTAFDLTEQRRARLLLDRLVRATNPENDSTALAETRRRRAEAAPRNLPEVQAGLAPGTAMLLYLTGPRDTPTSVFTVTSTTVSGAVLPPAGRIAAQVDRLVRLLESGAGADSLAADLGRSILAPAVAGLGPDITSLIIVPDGALHSLPFEVLRPSGARLLDRFAVVMAPSATVAVRRSPQGESRPVTLLAFGDPEFAPAAGLPRLPGTAAEVELAGRFAERSTVRQRSQASEAEFNRIDVTPFRIIHFATHALIDAERPARTHLTLAPGAGADGNVLAADLASRPLTADLVVLSACRTAKGTVVGGEGVQGLTSPLLAAGAKSIVATLWPVADQRATALVRLLYEGMARGRTVAEALQEAKRALVRAGAPPRDWAGFVVIGNGAITIPFRRPDA